LTFARRDDKNIVDFVE